MINKEEETLQEDIQKKSSRDKDCLHQESSSLNL
jgi:hypothetical protein